MKSQNSSRRRVLCVYGTRPEAIKVAPLILKSRQHRDIDMIACSTGQHREMLDQVHSHFSIQADIDLRLMREGQSLPDLTARCLQALSRVIAEHQPDVVLGQGDTTSALCAGMAAFYAGLPFVHVEAGLRTTDIRSPFPEELNRRICSLVTALHCAPTSTAADNLLREGHSSENIVVTGNTVIDALMWTVRKVRTEADCWIQKHPEIAGRRVVLITAHRRENHGDGILNLCDAVRQLSRQYSGVQFVFPVHPNPGVCRPVHERLAGVPNIHLIEPAEYPEFVWLMDQSTLIVSDSGGVQEEAPTLGKPVLVTRHDTERPEALAAGATTLIGMETERIVHEVSRLLVDKDAYAAMQVEHNPYGTGHAADIILDLITERFCAPSADGTRSGRRSVLGTGLQEKETL